MNWNWRATRALMRKDLKQVLTNKMVWLPIVIVPLVLLVLMPAGLVLMPTLVPAELNNTDTDMLLQVLPQNLQDQLEELTPEQQWIILSANYMFAPMFLIIPLMVASILGADSFAGEKERKTLEGLLYTPLSDTQLFGAKLATALIPALVVNVVSFVLYGLVVNLAGYATMGRIFFPASHWWPLVFWLGPGVSLAGLGAVVLVSSKAKTFMEAQQISGVLVVPIVALMIGQTTGLFFFGMGIILLLGLAFWVAGAWLVWIGAKTFSRGEIIAKI
ncbi:MAG: ABC transporter permease subunit [Anaerolineae bacterium]